MQFLRKFGRSWKGSRDVRSSTTTAQMTSMLYVVCCAEMLLTLRSLGNTSITSRKRLISFTNFNAQFLYSLTICMFHYSPRHVSSINMPVFRRTNCITTASGIITLCKRLYRWEHADIWDTVQPFTESDTMLW